MKAPEMVPSARERIDAACARWDDPNDLACVIEDLRAEAMEQARRDGYAAGFAAALAMLADADLRAAVSLKLAERDTWGNTMPALKETFEHVVDTVLNAASALADSAGREGE